MESFHEVVTKPVLKEANEVYVNSKTYIQETFEEIKYECIPTAPDLTQDSLTKRLQETRQLFHIPYSPAYSHPGWLVKLINDPKDEVFWQGIYGDVFGGFTVGFTVIPQALSYAALANLPVQLGLYAVIWPTVINIIFGTAAQLVIGPVALVSLLMGTLVTKYGLTATSPDIIDFAAQTSFCVGILLLCAGSYFGHKLDLSF